MIFFKNVIHRFSIVYIAVGHRVQRHPKTDNTATREPGTAPPEDREHRHPKTNNNATRRPGTTPGGDREYFGAAVRFGFSPFFT